MPHLASPLSGRLPAAFRTRFAPAPTGRLHLGHAVNAAWVWSVARAFGGRVVLRIEDHDRRRCRPEWEAALLDDLEWLGLLPDEHPPASFRSPGPHPARQSDREVAYAAALAALEAQGLVYACRCSRREIAARVPHGADEEPVYPGTCREAGLDGRQWAARRVRLVDMAVPIDDLRHGPEVQHPARQCGDLLARDRDGQWTYQFAVVVDDLAQGIDLIIRGDDLRSSTGRQRQLMGLLGAARVPEVLHHPLVRHPDGSKLSKSRGDTGLGELRAAGWSAERVLGYAAWLGGLAATDAPRPATALADCWR